MLVLLAQDLQLMHLFQLNPGSPELDLMNLVAKELSCARGAGVELSGKLAVSLPPRSLVSALFRDSNGPVLSQIQPSPALLGRQLY